VGLNARKRELRQGPLGMILEEKKRKEKKSKSSHPQYRRQDKMNAIKRKLQKRLQYPVFRFTLGMLTGGMLATLFGVIAFTH